MINLIVSILILVLLILLFVKEIRSELKVDLFLNSVIAFIGIISPIVSFVTDKFAFTEVYDYIFIACIVVDIVYTIFFITKYFKQKKEHEIKYDCEEEDEK